MSLHKIDVSAVCTCMIEHPLSTSIRPYRSKRRILQSRDNRGFRHDAPDWISEPNDAPGLSFSFSRAAASILSGSTEPSGGGCLVLNRSRMYADHFPGALP